MVILIISFLLMYIIALLLLAVASVLSTKMYSDLEKSSPFECGFIPHSQFRVPFSLHFFLITILFLVFDVELVLLFPLLLKTWHAQISHTIFIVVLALLTWGLVVEWSQKMLDWANY